DQQQEVARDREHHRLGGARELRIARAARELRTLQRSGVREAIEQRDARGQVDAGRARAVVALRAEALRCAAAEAQVRQEIPARLLDVECAERRRIARLAQRVVLL